MGPDMPLFKAIMDASKSELNTYCQKYSGLYHYAKILENVAQACAEGKLNAFL